MHGLPNGVNVPNVGDAFFDEYNCDELSQRSVSGFCISYRGLMIELLSSDPIKN